jgi:predicted lactoylglutathione lyase
VGAAKAHSASEFACWGAFDLFVVAAGDDPATRNLHIAFFAESRDLVDAFWRAGTGAGYRDDGAPGPRPQYGDEYYGGFLLDPDGNSVEAVHHGAPRTPGQIEHLWIRVADLGASRAFYETIAPDAGFAVAGEESDPDRVRFGNNRGSFSVVDGEPTVNVHVAVPAVDHAAVDDFHRTATDAGHRDNGAPGERPEYHAGYYGAYVLDPDGNNVEVVHHGKS